MKSPKRLQPLIDDGFVDEVVRQLKSGKEADVFMVRCGDEFRCAKVYKEARQRAFRGHAEYSEGRRTRNSRRARAMTNGTRYGRQEREAAWQNAEVDALFRCASAGVQVPQPHLFVDGVLLMELIIDDAGHAAPRLDDIVLSAARAREYHRLLMDEVVRMLCAGLIHGDLSEYNVLVGRHGPVIIDLPQAVDAAGNNNACRMLVRDVANLTAYFSRYAPELARTDYAQEIWSLFETGRLVPDIPLTGTFEREERSADVDAVLREIAAAREEALALRQPATTEDW